MAARFQQLKGTDSMKHTRSLPTISQPDDRVVVRQEAMGSSTFALNWSGSMALPISLRASQAQSLDDLGPVEGTQIVSPVGRVTWPLAITAVAAILGASFPHGWNTGVLNAPSYLIKDFINGSYVENFGSAPTEQVLSIFWATAVSIYLVGGFIGAFSAGWLAEKFGRKRALLLLHIFNYASAVLFCFCQYANSIAMLIIARAVVGFACGAGSGIVPMYLTEIAPVNVRGAMGVLHQFALTCGILASQIFGMRQLMGNERLWPFLLAASAVPCAISMVTTVFFPDSPRYLFVTKGNREAAEAALRRFRGTEDVSLDIREMEMEVKAQEQDPEWTFMELMKAKSLRMPLLIVCSLACCQQLSGINVVFYYSTSIFLASGITLEYVQYAVLATGIINVLMTAISIPLMEKSGRRPLLLVGMVVMILSLVVITLALNLQERLGFMAYLSLVCIITFVVGFAIGLGSIPQFIGGELFMQGPRPPAMSLAGFLNWLCNFLVGITFPSMALAMGQYSFCVFIGIMVGFLILLWKVLPETKNKTYQDIYKMFNKGHESLDSKPIVKNGLPRDVTDSRLYRSDGDLPFHKSASAPGNTRLFTKPDVEMKPMPNGKARANTDEGEALLWS